MEERAKKGYFLFEDGTKSTDPANKERVKKPKDDSKTKKAKKGQVDSDLDSEPEVYQPPKVKPAYSFFVEEYMNKHKGKGVAIADAGPAWKELTADEKERFAKMKEADAARRQR